MSPSVKLIFTAITAIGLMIPGVNALESTLKDLIIAKKGEAIEVCVLESAKFKVSEIECRFQKYQKIDKDFGLAVRMIAGFKEVFQLQDDKVNEANQAKSGS